MTILPLHALALAAALLRPLCGGEARPTSPTEAVAADSVMVVAKDGFGAVAAGDAAVAQVDAAENAGAREASSSRVAANPYLRAAATSPADLTKDTICFPYGLPPAYKVLFDKMDTLLTTGRGRVKVLHLGGSHVEGGVLTGRLRSNLLALGGGAADFGLVFPFTAASMNTPWFYTSRFTGRFEASKNTQKAPTSRMGLMGMAVTAASMDAGVSIVTRPRGSSGRGDLFDQVQVCGYPAWYQRDTASMRPVVLLSGGDTLLPESFPEDSLFKFYLPQATDSVCVSLPLGFTLTGVRLLNYSPGFSVVAAGVNGASLASWGRCEDLLRDIDREAPDIVLLAIGINDASGANFDPDLFKERYSALVKGILEFNPDCAVLFVTNNDSRRRASRRSTVVNANGPLVRQAFMELGEEWNAGVWDLFGIMGGLGSMDGWRDAGLARGDRVHFTQGGYEVLGDLLFNALMDSYMKYKTAAR